MRGYGREWQRIRARVLREYGIPRSQWRLYEIDHRPRYQPEIEPDHNKYNLVPMLKSEHSRKTVAEDGGFGRPKAGEGRSKNSNTEARKPLRAGFFTECHQNVQRIQ